MFSLMIFQTIVSISACRAVRNVSVLCMFVGVDMYIHVYIYKHTYLYSDICVKLFFNPFCRLCNLHIVVQVVTLVE